MKKRVLLTGASGSIGYQTLQKLIEKDLDITVLDLPGKKSRGLLEKFRNKIKILYGSVNDTDLVDKAISGADIVIHLAAVIPPLADKNCELAKKVNYFGTENIVNAIKYFNPRCFLIYSSSISVYGDRVENFMINVGDELNASEGDYYALTKIAAERMIREAGIGYTIFRFSAIMGLPHTDPLMFHMPLDTKLEIASSNTTARALAEACFHTEELNGRVFNLGGGVKCRTDYKTFLAEMLKIYGLNFKHFKAEAFAERNFHCGYYEDSHILNGILDFQRETLDEYYAYVRKNTPKVLRFFTRVASRSVAYFLCKSSEPYIARKKKLVLETNRYFK
ncbi:MAG: NAD(P)-dependent oxidoreductase [Clostridiales bacterium]|jgi:nucleoside-diphosphate-sugar epimerase|nr:NAD(P)-dependent oxidoreductase [Clostridiales bacterium]